MAYKAETLRKQWDGIATAGEKLAVRIHNTAVHTLEHFKAHGDTSLMAYAVNVLQKRGTNRRALIQWFEKHGRVVQSIQDNAVVFHKKKGADHTTIDVDKAKTSPFYDDDSTDGRTATDLKSFNLWGRMRAAIKREREIRQEVLANSKANKIEDLTPADFKRAGYDPDKTPLVSEEMLNQMEVWIETYGNLDKPQPKADKPVFTGAHPYTDGEPTLKAVDAA